MNLSVCANWYFLKYQTLSRLCKDPGNNLRCGLVLKYFWNTCHVATGPKQSLLLETDISLPCHEGDLKTPTLVFLEALCPPLCFTVFGKHSMAAVCVWPTSAHLTERGGGSEQQRVDMLHLLMLFTHTHRRSWQSSSPASHHVSCSVFNV